MRSAAWSSRCFDPAWMVTAAPRAANALAVASPIPALAPMITTRCPSNDMFIQPFEFVETLCTYKLYRYSQSRQTGRLAGHERDCPAPPAYRATAQRGG